MARILAPKWDFPLLPLRTCDSRRRAWHVLLWKFSSADSWNLLLERIGKCLVCPSWCFLVGQPWPQVASASSLPTAPQFPGQYIHVMLWICVLGIMYPKVWDYVGIYVPLVFYSGIMRPNGILLRDHVSQWYLFYCGIMCLSCILLRDHVSQLYFMSGSCVSIVFYSRIVCPNCIYFLAESCDPVVFYSRIMCLNSILYRDCVSQWYFIARSCVLMVFYGGIMCPNGILYRDHVSQWLCSKRWLKWSSPRKKKANFWKRHIYFTIVVTAVIYKFHNYGSL